MRDSELRSASDDAVPAGALPAAGLSDEKRKCLEMLETFRGGAREDASAPRSGMPESTGASDGERGGGSLPQELRRTKEFLRLHRALGAHSDSLQRCLEELARRWDAEPGQSPRCAACGMRSALRGARQKASLLENEIAALEQKTLDAIAEAGALRRQLDLLRESRETGGDWGEVAREQETLRRRLREEEEERHLLTRALSDSETEIARLARSLEQLVRSFAAA